jgi:flagellin-like hook-associated protein FlgL
MQNVALKNFVDIVTSAKEIAVVSMNDLDVNRSVPIAERAKDLLSLIEDQLQTSYFGMNIWNGSRINEVPCTDLVNGIVSENYYLGDNFNLKFYPDKTTLEFGDRANYDCFKNLINALQTIRDAQVNHVIDRDKVSKASVMLDNAQDGFTQLLQKVGYAQKAIVEIKDATQELSCNLSDLYHSTLNGMSEEKKNL